MKFVKGLVINQARSQKFEIEGCFGDLEAKSPAAAGVGVLLKKIMH